jgi:hypothetical protein
MKGLSAEVCEMTEVVQPFFYAVAKTMRKHEGWISAPNGGISAALPEK